jgi:putative heme transporter
MTAPKPIDPRRLQVSVRTLLSIAVGGLLVWLFVVFVSRTLLALALSLSALMVAIALNHGVALLERRGLARKWAIAVVLMVALALIAGLGFLIVPPAVSQGKALANGLPEILKAARGTAAFETLDRRLHLANRLQELEHELPQMLEGAAAPLLSVVGGVVTGVAAVVSVVVVAVFMLIFGGQVVQSLMGETLPERRPIYAAVIEKTYRSIGGYLSGLGLICFINATLTTTFLAIVGLPFFLPLGILSGLSSLVPYAGPVVVGAIVSLIALATEGTGTGVACVIYFVAYGQLEGQVLAPLIFRRTVHVNPLVVVLSILFFGELAGIFGAVAAVPAAAALQIILRELLRVRRERLNLPATPLNSPEQVEE